MCFCTSGNYPIAYTVLFGSLVARNVRASLCAKLAFALLPFATRKSGNVRAVLRRYPVRVAPSYVQTALSPC